MEQYLLTIVLAVVAGVAGGVVASLVLTGRPVFAQPTPEQARVIQARVIQAEEFVVVDKYGKVRAMFGIGGWYYHGEPGLELYDKDGNVHVRFGIRNDGQPDLTLSAKDSKNRFTLAPFGLAIFDQNGKNRAALKCEGFVSEDGKLHALLNSVGEPDLTLYGKDKYSHAWLVPFGLMISDGKTRVQLVLRSGEPELTLYDENQKSHATLVPSGIGLFDQNGKLRATLDGEPEPLLKLYDKDEKTRAELGYAELKNTLTGSEEKRSASSLVLFGEDGKVIWEAP